MLTVSFPQMEFAMWNQILGRKSRYFYLYSYKLHPFLDAETFHITLSPQFQFKFYNQHVQLYQLAVNYPWA